MLEQPRNPRFLRTSLPILREVVFLSGLCDQPF